MNTTTPPIIKKLQAILAIPGLLLIIAGVVTNSRADDAMYHKYAIPMIIAGFILITIGSVVRVFHLFKNMNNNPN